jgi:hypothetical protein
MSGKINTRNAKDFLETLGLNEEPVSIYYTDVEPGEGITPKPGSR